MTISGKFLLVETWPEKKRSEVNRTIILVIGEEKWSGNARKTWIYRTKMLRKSSKFNYFRMLFCFEWQELLFDSPRTFSSGQVSTKRNFPEIFIEWNELIDVLFFFSWKCLLHEALNLVFVMLVRKWTFKIVCQNVDSYRGFVCQTVCFCLCQMI